MCWNANGISSRLPELSEIIVRLEPDVLIFNKTHLTPDRQFQLPNYMCYQDDSRVLDPAE